MPGGAVLHACADVGGAHLLLADDAAAEAREGPAGGAPPAAGGVYLGGDAARLAALVGDAATPRRAVRLFAGEAAWSAGQLEAELARGEWLLAQATPEWVLGAGAHGAHASGGECQWARAMKALGGEHAAMAALPTRVGRDDQAPDNPFSVRVHLL